MRYVSDGTWFKKGTEAVLIDDYRPSWDSGLFSGLRVTEDPGGEGGDPVGHEYADEEICFFDEFDVYDDDGNLVQVASRMKILGER